MKSIQTTIVVDADGKATIQLTPGVTPGLHQAVVVLDEPVVPRAPLTFADREVGPSP